MKKKQNHYSNEARKPPTPIWKRVVIITLIIALPLFFWFIRNLQMQNLPASEQTPVNINSELKDNY